MSETAEVTQQQGFYWDKRGKVTANWIEADLSRFKRLAQTGDVAAAGSRQRVQDQIMAYIAKVESGRVIQRKTLERIGKLAAEFDGLAGTDLAVKLAAAAAAKLTQKTPTAWDVRGRVVPAWMRQAAESVQRSHKRLADAERALKDEQTAAQIKRVERARAKVLAAEARYAEMTAHGKSQIEQGTYTPKPATIETVAHYAAAVEDVKVASALAAGSSLSRDRYAALAEKLRRTVEVLKVRKGFMREADDAGQQGFLGLQHAAQKWSVAHPKRARLVTYATSWIGRFMECRNDTGLAPGKHRKGTPKRISVDTHEDEESSSFRHPVAKDDTQRAGVVQVLLGSLSDEERGVVEEVAIKRESYRTAAKKLGISEARVRTIYAECMDKLRKAVPMDLRELI